MRLHWPEGVIHQSDVDTVRPDWWDTVIDEFFVSHVYTLISQKFKYFFVFKQPYET